jgi:site-specific recombinase XerD
MQEKIREYLDWKGTYAPRACVNYRIWLDYFIQVCGEKAIEEYNTSDVVKYHIWLESRFKSYSASYAIIILKNFFKFYREQNCKCISPSLIKTPPIIAKSHRAVSEGEFNRILSVIPSNTFLSLRNLVIVRMLWDTGIRVSELTDLDITQIDEHRHSTVIITKKTGKKRMILWSQETHRLLLRYISLRLKLEKLNSASALFVGRDRNKTWSLRITKRTIERIVKHYVDRAGINERISPHSFRHGWAHKRRDQNAPLSFIQRGLGHISPVSTFIYQNYHDWEFEKSARKYLKTA